MKRQFAYAAVIFLVVGLSAKAEPPMAPMKGTWYLYWVDMSNVRSYAHVGAGTYRIHGKLVEVLSYIEQRPNAGGTIMVEWLDCGDDPFEIASRVAADVDPSGTLRSRDNSEKPEFKKIDPLTEPLRSLTLPGRNRNYLDRIGMLAETVCSPFGSFPSEPIPFDKAVEAFKEVDADWREKREH